MSAEAVTLLQNRTERNAAFAVHSLINQPASASRKLGHRNVFAK